MSRQERMTEEFFNKMRKRKRSLDKNAIIWVVAILIGVTFFTVGIIDYQADYDSINRSSPQPVVYTRDDGVVFTRTYYPIFEKVNYEKPEGGFLPDNIPMTIHDWLILGIILMLGLPSILIYQAEGKRLRGIDENLPYLLREISDSQRIGMTLPRAIAEASKRNYGPLTSELKKLAAKISWGIPFRDAMKSFRNAVNTPLANQATILILEAERSGGELEKIFDSAQSYVQELLDIKKEREGALTPYVYIIFVSYVIFALVVYVLFTTFFAPFGVTEIIDPSGQKVVPVPLQAFKVGFLYLLVVQAFFSGLTAGKMGRGSVKLGLLYSTILMFIGLLINKLMIIPAVEAVEWEAAGIEPE
ncbi:MAG: type II secretion system F family protein [Candidatus Heimdallarchaeota archaeon]|nr:type II secretion system F family protein [Candidatus Heimdallarchaeota archaeon]